LESAVNEALNYLAQHSLAAAIEPAVERARQNKAAEAALEVAPWNGVEGWGFIWRDDGAGLDLAVLRERAVELGLKTTEEAKELPSGEVAQLIFSPGFVRANPDAPELSSALATLNRRVIEEKGGEIQVSSRAGRFTEFRVRWPECG
jgi:chemotaxis protein histidine kinase CheA